MVNGEASGKVITYQTQFTMEGERRAEGRRLKGV